MSEVEKTIYSYQKCLPFFFAAQTLIYFDKNNQFGQKKLLKISFLTQ